MCARKKKWWMDIREEQLTDDRVCVKWQRLSHTSNWWINWQQCFRHALCSIFYWALWRLARLAISRLGADGSLQRVGLIVFCTWVFFKNGIWLNPGTINTPWKTAALSITLKLSLIALFIIFNSSIWFFRKIRKWRHTMSGWESARQFQRREAK